MSDERKLATVRRIVNIEPIEGADRIVKVTVDGWSVVSQKENGFKIGDLVIYFEVDSVLPEREEFEFLRERCYVSAERSVNGAGFRLKTIKLRGQISQGLIIPIQENKIFHQSGGVWHVLGFPSEGYFSTVKEGIDLTDKLGVVKFEKPLPANLAGVARGNFPSFIPKTDEERIQNCFKYLQRDWIKENELWEKTIKLDGSSFTAYYRTHPDLAEGQFGVCSRNLELKETEGNAFWQVARKYDLENRMRELNRSLAIQGELMGPGVQGNREGLKDLHMFVFKIYDIDTQTYLLPNERYDICTKLCLSHVPVLRNVESLKDWTVEDFLREADGPSLYHEIREGIVFKSLTNPNLSFKVISNKFLLKGGE